MIGRRRFVLSFAGMAFAGCVRAHSYKSGNILIGHAWALPARTSEAQVFLPLANNGSEADELVAARSPIASMIEFRANNRYDHPPLASFRLEPGKPVPMRPTARHLRLIGLTMPLAAGGRFQLILDFLNAGEVEIEVFVEPAPSE
jgi:periplasmic copper chaperone A